MSSFERQNLIAEIEEAFKDDPPRPEEAITLHESEADDDWLSREKQLEARKLDTDRYWRDIPDEFMEKIPSPWSFLDPKGTRYYLPAFMRFVLKCSTIASGHATYRLVLELYPWTTTQGEAPKITVTSIAESLHLNKKQCKVIFHFLKFIEMENEIKLKDPEWVEALKEWRRLSE